MNDAIEPDVPLVVDLDGTLLKSDLLHESTLRLVRDQPHAVLLLPLWLARGKAVLKRRIAEQVDLTVETLPFDETVVAWVRGERERGRHTVLCTASDGKYAHEIARHLDIFDEVIASDGTENVSAERKAARLAARFGKGGFDYAGNAAADLPVWAEARQCIVVNAPDRIASEARARFRVTREFPRPAAGWRDWRRALRPHQWLKNLLLFLPMLGAHQLTNAVMLAEVFTAFVAFSLCASSVYVLNDLMDLESDRRHPRKRRRPFASGALSPVAGVVAVGALLGGGLLVAFLVRPTFVYWLLLYLITTVAYTFWLKRKAILDALSLAVLYTMRILAGAAAVELEASFWLLAFSLFLFLDLAFVKRCAELREMQARGQGDLHGRGYLSGDLVLVETMGLAAGYASVLVLALYINGGSVRVLYRQPELMWLTVPVLLYWVSRTWLLTHRGLMEDDPLVFAVTDRVSLLCGVLFLGVLWAAS
jgi:4-hydroxybenzoate polyprenyltransferase/phosphoserine phosphatase